MRKLGFIIGLVIILGFGFEALGAEFEFLGDMNNRFLIYTNHQDWLNSEQEGIIEDTTISYICLAIHDLSPHTDIYWGIIFIDIQHVV